MVLQLTCCWCNGHHPATCCPEKISIQEALNLLGIIRAKRVAEHIQAQYDRQMYWLDGKIVDHRPVRKEAIQRKRQKNATQ